MKCKVGVVKRITLLLMTMALAVAMVACQAATPKPAEKGDPGEQGEAGPQGPAGTTDNEPPMAVPDKPLENVYLALGGSGKMDKKMGIDLSKYFTDAESVTLGFSAKSDTPDVATVKVEAGKLTVEGKKVGMATVTVMVHDSVNDPVEATFDVMVVADNAKPTVVAETGTPALGATTPGGATEAAKLAKKLYVSNGPQTFTVQSSVYPGLAVGVEDDVYFDTVVMGAKGAGDDVVKVSVKKKAGTVDMWEVTLDPVNAGHQNVEVTVTDKFGAKADTKWMFQAVVNTVPMKVFDLPATMVLDKSDEAGTADDSVINIDRYFETVEKSPTGVPSEDGTTVDTTAATTAQQDAVGAEEATLVPQSADVDGVEHMASTCTYSTSPDQTVSSDDATTTILAQMGSGSAAVVDGDLTVSVPIQKVGTFDLTIVCRDEEGSDHGTTKVTVRP